MASEDFRPDELEWLLVEFRYSPFVPFAVIGKKWKLTFAGWSRPAQAAFHEMESSFLPERRVSGLDQPLAAPPCTSATGH